uniref:ZAD domain-containing protein n=1 Tax=Anopheles atroparvus TaxID=41427 RepID=A0AAG5D3Q9_ANOAO
MDMVPTAISVQTCRFCLSPNEQTKSFFERFNSEVLSSILNGLLGIQLDPSDQYSNICEKCTSKVELIFSLMTEFRKANELFCSLVEQKQQNDIK